MYRVVIQRVADGEMRVCEMGGDWAEDGGDWFWWTDGNMGCDCNRELQFLRAGDDTEPEDVHCSENRFLVLEFQLPEGRVIDGPDRPEDRMVVQGSGQ